MTTQKLEESIVLGEMIPLRKHDNKTSNYEFTNVVPVFNDEDNMLALEEKLSAFVSESLLDTCVLFVNDSSIVQSKERIVEVCRRQKHFYHHSLEKNSGLSAELVAEIDATQSKFVGYIDAGLQTMRKDFLMLISNVGESGLVIPREVGKSKFNPGNWQVAPFIDWVAYRWTKNRYITFQI